MRNLIKKVLSYFADSGRVGLRQIYASHAAFYTIVSSIPMLLLVAQFFSRLSPDGAQKLILRLLDALPGKVASALPESFLSPFAGASFPLISITALTLVWSSSKGMLAVSAGVRAVYGSDGRRSLVKRYLIALLFTLFFLFLTVFALCVLVLGPSISSALSRLGSVYVNLTDAITRLGWLFALGIFTLSFALMYRFMSDVPTFRRHLPGAAFAGAGWLLLSGALSAYLRLFDPYSIYGSLGALLLMMLWVRFCMSILLFGAELNLYFSKHPPLISSRRDSRQSKTKRSSSEDPPSEIF